MTWLLLYPRTMWRALRHPLELAAYAEAELTEDLEHQFPDLISPPLFLMLSILVTHRLEMVLHEQITNLSSDLGRTVVESDQNLLLARSLVYALFPLLMALGRLRLTGGRADRDSLRQPFFVQCFLAAPFAVMLTTASVLVRQSDRLFLAAGLAVALGAVIWYMAVETAWFHRRLGIGQGRAFTVVLRQFVIGVLLIFFPAYVVLKQAATGEG